MRDTKKLICTLGLSLILVGMTGCATVVHAPLARRSEGIPSGNRGQSNAVVFSGPAIASAMSQTPDWVRPEFARNNDNLALAQPRALTAIDQWPQAPRPTIEHQRRTTLSQSARQIIIFSDGQGYGGRQPQYGPTNRGNTRGGYNQRGQQQSGHNGQYNPRHR